jgi:hypothetical protein
MIPNASMRHIIESLKCSLGRRERAITRRRRRTEADLVRISLARGRFSVRLLP